MSLDYPETITVDIEGEYQGWVLRELISEKRIKERVSEIGRQITENYRDKTPILILFQSYILIPM